MGIHELWKLWALINHHTLCWIKVTPGLPSCVSHWAVPPVSQSAVGWTFCLIDVAYNSFFKNTEQNIFHAFPVKFLNIFYGLAVPTLLSDRIHY